jgi:methionyl-tRNA formyltransferase
MTKIACLTQRPIQTIILLYLLGKDNYKFDHIFYSPLREKKSNFNDEGLYSYNALKYQCNLQKIPLTKLSNLNSKKIIFKLKNKKIKTCLALITDTILKEDILKCFNNGIYLTHGGILPKYRGIDANKWALLKKSNTVGLTMLKLGKGVDDGEIVEVKKIRVKTRKVDFLEKELFYKYKLYMYRDLFHKLKRKNKIKLTKQTKIYPQYFRMHNFLEDYIKKI